MKSDQVEDKVQLIDINKGLSILNNVNWDFSQRRLTTPNKIYPFDCRHHHWYPATFIPEIPFTLIEVLSKPNATVFDPFGGIGTTYFQSLLLERFPITTEICSIAVNYMKALFNLFDPGINWSEIIKDLDDLVDSYDLNRNYIEDLPDNILIDKLIPWYSKNTFNQITFLCSELHHIEQNETLKALLEISISANLKSSSSQDRGWGCIADNVKPKEKQLKDKNFIKNVQHHSNRLTSDIKKHVGFLKDSYTAFYDGLSHDSTIYHTDVRKASMIPDSSIDLLITSPPYPNMADYVTSQRLSYYLFGYEVNPSNIQSTPDFEMEIGARRKRFKNTSLDKYENEMKEVNLSISKQMKNGGLACFVLPEFNKDNDNNKNRRKIISEVLSHLEEECDFEKVGEFIRVLPTKRRHHNQKWARLDKEKIYIFQRK